MQTGVRMCQLPATAASAACFRAAVVGRPRGNSLRNLDPHFAPGIPKVTTGATAAAATVRVRGLEGLGEQRLLNLRAWEGRKQSSGGSVESTAKGISAALPSAFGASFSTGVLGYSQRRGVRKGHLKTPVAMTSAASEASKKKVLVPIADGTEEMEAVIIVDVLRRAGADVTVASVEKSLQILASRNVHIVADTLITDVADADFDLIALPGGAVGAEHLRDSETLDRILQAQQAANRPLAAICASPVVVFQPKGLLKGKSATAHPAFVSQLDPSESKEVEKRVIVDGTLTTSRGPGTSVEFALSLVATLYGEEAAAAVEKPMVTKNSDDPAAQKLAIFNDGDALAPGDPTARRILVPIADGTEEMEAVIIIDVLRRAGAEVVVASVEEGRLQVLASRGVKLVADTSIEDAANQTFDAIILPGGMPGATRLNDNSTLTKLLEAQAASSKLYGAICAAPAVALESKGLLEGKKATAHPAFVSKLADQSVSGVRVVSDGVVITSRGPGTAIEYSLAIVTRLFGPEKAASVAAPMVIEE